VLHEINDSQKYMRTQGLNVYQCAKNNAFQTHLTEKRENLIDDALSQPKNVCENLGISMRPSKRKSRKCIFGDGDGSKDEALSYENELRRQLFSSLSIRFLYKFTTSSSSFRI